MKKILSLLIMVFMCGAMVTAVAPVNEVVAASSSKSDKCTKTFFGMRPWYAGLTESKDGNCVIKWPVKEGKKADGDQMAAFIWKIILNISADVSLMVALNILCRLVNLVR